MCIGVLFMSLTKALAFFGVAISSAMTFTPPSLYLHRARLPKSVRPLQIPSLKCIGGIPDNPHEQQAKSLYALLRINPTKHNIEMVSGKIKNVNNSLKRQERQDLNHFLNDLISFLYYLKRLNKHDLLITLKQGIVNKDLTLINTFIKKTKDTFIPSVLTNGSTPDKIRRFYLTPHKTILNRLSVLLTSTDQFTSQVKNNLLMALQLNLKQDPSNKNSRLTFPLGQLIILNALSQKKLNSHFRQLSITIDYLKSQNDVTTLQILFDAIKTHNDAAFDKWKSYFLKTYYNSTQFLNSPQAFKNTLIDLNKKDHFFNYLLALLHYDYSTDLQSVSKIKEIEQHRRAVLTLLNKTILDM